MFLLIGLILLLVETDQQQNLLQVETDQQPILLVEETDQQLLLLVDLIKQHSILLDLILLVHPIDQHLFLLVSLILLLDHFSDHVLHLLMIVIGLKCSTQCLCMRDDGELLLSPQQVTLGKIRDIIFGGPRVMVDLTNLHGSIINDPQGRLKSAMTWVSQVY